MSDKKITTTRGSVGVLRKHTRNDRQMEFLLDKYLAAHPDHDGSEFDPDEICEWALRVGIYNVKPIRPVDQLKRRFCRHLNHRYITDPQDREVRALHAVPYEEITSDGVKQGFKYYPLFTTEPEKIKLSLGNRRRGAFNRVLQIEKDRLSYNDNNVFKATIDQMSFNFDPTIAESLMPTTYPDSPPDDVDKEDDEKPTVQ